MTDETTDPKAAARAAAREALIEEFGLDEVVRLEGIRADQGADAANEEVRRLRDAREAQLPAVQQQRVELVATEGGYIVPRSMDEAYRYAVAVVHAKLAPDSYGNEPDKVMLGIAAAMEAGLPPLYGLRQIAIIQGRPTIWGDAAIALVQSKNLLTGNTKEKIGTIPAPGTPINEWADDYGFRVSLSRRHQTDPYVGEFTVGDAKRAKLWMNTRKVPWIEHPDRMLFNRARGWALRDGFADALAGLALREEVEDMHGEDKPAQISTAFLDDDADQQPEANAAEAA
ncbi:hypothetical protein [Sphingomonas crocodyli]|uniref:Recombinase RecT n=1 Tax=Sphingomonas crocodyli TaxID=1979270 RepID=A0A437M8B2_9SPHN|nr:hypothetical protein [Sphingomonas crocodyli]RVT93734.1 hypothetical protein EOD43_07665 [Sphingomonas crocodyli]